MLDDVETLPSTNEDLQRMMEWMQSVIVDPRPDEEVEADETARAAQWVKPNDRLSSFQRVMLYRDQYLIRLGDALKLDYPALARYLGPAHFRTLVHRYLQAYPSRSYSLYRLSDHLVDFIEGCQEVPQQGVCKDLARLELAMAQVFHAPLVPPLSVEAFDAIAGWDRACLVPVPALRMARFTFPVNDYLQSMIENKPLPNMMRRAQWIAVFRSGYDMFRLDMKRHEFRALSALVEGRTLDDALTLAVSGPEAADAVQVSAWIKRWCGLGLFAEARIEKD